MAKRTTADISMAETGEQDSSAFKSAHWKKLSPAWKYTQDLWGTALDIRELGTEYLTQFNKEPDHKFRGRLNASVFTNTFRETIETMTGMVFRTDPTPGEIHVEIAALMPDIDLCGNSFWDFCCAKFDIYQRDGNGFIYVDMPKIKPEVAEKIAAGQKPTLKDREGDRPYWVFYEASQLINCRFERVGSRYRFTQATLEEKVMVPDGEFGEKEVTQHRILRPGSFEVKQKDKHGRFTIPGDAGQTGIDEILLYPFNPDLMNPPPFLTLGMLNVQNYNQKSDYDNICHLVCTPREVRKYDSDTDAEKAAKIQTASPGVGIKIWGQHADVKYVEVSGTGMQLARDRYQDVEQEMAAIGIAHLSPNDLASIRTATEVMDNAGNRQSKLSKRAREFANCIEKALYGTAQCINAIKGAKTINLAEEEKDAKMRLKIDYDRLTFTIEQLEFFNALVDSGKLSLQTFLEWLPQVADMPPGFDPAAELRRIARVNSLVDDEEDDPETLPPGDPPNAE